MRNRVKEVKKNSIRWTAGSLIIVLISLSGTTLCPVPAYAYQADLSVQNDIWEEMEIDGEVMVSFPSQIEAAISSADDEDRYSFCLEGTADLTLTLESEYPCAMELIHQGQTIASSLRPYSQILEPAGLEAGTFTVKITPQEHVETSSYVLRISRQADRTMQPDYSEAHMAGTLFDPESPFRSINIQNEAEKNRGGSPVMAVHYLAHWQGPVDESVVPYYDKGDFGEVPSDYIKYKKAEPDFHVQNAIALPGFQEDGGHIEHWKNAIMTYGSIDTGFYTSYCYRDKNEGDGWPEYDYEYLYMPKNWDYEKYGGHATLIVGWDDTIEKENFRITKRDEAGALIDETMPEQDGAWICKDSYGGLFPDYFLVSYESLDFGTVAFTPMAFAPAEQNDNYNHMYSNTSSGMTDVAMSSSGFLRGVQVFQNEGESELLRAVGFYAGQGEISYEIRVRIGDGPLESVKTGYLKYPGYYTARLDQGVMIPPGSGFEIHVALSGDDDKRILFYSCRNVEGWINGVKAIPGKAYYYTDWEGNSEWVDASALGEYPYICAYTYSPLKQEITLLDNKEAAGEIGKATVSEAARLAGEYEVRASASEADRFNDKDVDRASSSDAPRASSSDAPRASSSDATRASSLDATRASRSDAICASSSDAPRASSSNATRATPSNATSADDWDYADDLEDNLLLDDSEEDAQARADELRLWSIRNSPDGAIPNEAAEDIDVSPLNLHFPEQYDSRILRLITKVKNQGNSSLCWTFSAAGALEASYLRYGNQMIDYPRGLNLISRENPITDSTISLKLKKGEALPLNLAAVLYSDSRHFNPGSPQIYWEISGDLNSVEGGAQLSDSGETVCALTALAPGRVTVTAVSMADISLKALCQVEIMEMAPAKVHIEPETLDLRVGEVRKLKTTVESDEELTVLYSSDRPGVVSVDKNGQVIALRPGLAVITAKAGDGEATCAINVSERSRSDNDDGDGAVTSGPGTQDTVRGSWEQNGDQWRFKKEDGGYAVSTWERIKGAWYYFKEDANAASGWFYDSSYQRWFYLEESRAMSVGWKQIEGKWYYFHTVSDGGMGRMYTDQQTPDGYMVGADGAWIN